MKACESTARISILVNGSPTEEFSPQRGLRQGDPLSPFLFNIVFERLNILLVRALNLSILNGVVVGTNNVLISHLQFADDSILFYEADWDQLASIKKVRRCFEVLSSLKINYQKSVVCGVGANLGRKSTWKPVLNKIKSRLSGWTRKLLSFADCQVWSNASVGQFSVSTLYSHSSSLLVPHLRICKLVWSSVLPPRVSFFYWLAWKNRIKRSDFLLRIGILDNNVSSLCPFCSSELESATHVLLHCPFPWLIWSAVIEDWGFHWCILKSVDGLLTWWMSDKFQKRERSIWRAIPLIVLWSLC
ncbi:uncharacterized protein LOC114321152 [Camellia sinensis]|uniref:uncharacterized protein LOC114321152 n=1 Tax=Camellia sinensis TaxID=4442 RepID=UPI0010363E7C|nr:uncharacterized protein LOC114321152 [Camellia sinensis]